MTIVELANLIPDAASRELWIRQGMPLDLEVVAQLCLAARQGVVSARQATLSLPLCRGGAYAAAAVTPNPCYMGV